MKRVIILFFSLAIMLAASVGKIAVSKGDVFVIRGAEKLSAKSGFELLERDIVQTAENARAQIVFNDDTVVSIGRTSEFQVEEFLYEEGAGEEKQKASFKALKGAFKTITGQIGKIAPKKFNIQSRTATIGIRGTHLLGKISVESDKIACTHGAIGVTSLVGGDEIIVPAGQITTVAMGQMPTPPRKYTAAEIQELNEASGASAKEAEEPAEASEGEAAVSEDEEAKEEEEPAPAEEEVVAEDDTVTDSSTAESESAVETIEEVAKVAEVIENVSKEQSSAVNENIVKVVEDTTGVDLGTPEPEPVSDSAMNADGYYSLGAIKSTGPINMYGKNLSSGISSAACDGIWCENTDITTSTGYRSKEMQLQRDKNEIAVNEGQGLGVISETEVQPALFLEQEVAFSATTEISEDARGVVGQADSYDTITGTVMMTIPSDAYAGFNVQYKSVSETSGSSESTYIRDEWWSYDNLGEFFVIADTTSYASTADYIRNSGMYFGKKSSFDSLPSQSFLIYQLIMETGYHYDSTENRVVSYLNQDFEGDDIYKSRAISNTANGNMLFVYPPQATEQGMGWGFVVGKSDGSNGNVALNGTNFWMNPEKDDSGNYYVDYAIHTADGELYGSEFQGVGMQLSNGDPDATDTSSYAEATSGPGSFETMLVAGYRTDSADMINLPSVPQTTGGSLVGWTASRFLYDSDDDGSREWTHLPARITISPDRATGDITGTIVMGSMAGGSISSPEATMTIGGTGGSTSAYISDDYFASTITASESTNYGAMTLLNDYGGYLATAPIFPVDDVSWGYFTAEFLDSGDKELLFYHKSTWVAGTLTDSTKISQLASGELIYDFEGKVLGNIYSETKGKFVDSINTDSSRVHIKLNFGTSDVVDEGFIRFTTRDNPNVIWYANIDSSDSSINSSGFYTANLSEKVGSVVKITDPYSTTEQPLSAGKVYGNLYGEEGGSLGGKFNLYGSFKYLSTEYGELYPDNLMAVGVIKASKDTELSAPVLYDNVLKGGHSSAWISKPVVDGTWSDASQTEGSAAGMRRDLSFFIGVSGDELTYQDFGLLEYTIEWDVENAQFASGAIGYYDPSAESMTLGSVTPEVKTMMTAPTGSYSMLNIERSVNEDGADKFVMYDNLTEFVMVLERKLGDETTESYNTIVIAGTESDYSVLISETDYIAYQLIGRWGMEMGSDYYRSGIDTPYPAEGSEEFSLATILNPANETMLLIGKPTKQADGKYGFFVQTGIMGEAYDGTQNIDFIGIDYMLGMGNAVDFSGMGGNFYGSESQAIATHSSSVDYAHSALTASIRTDDISAVTLPVNLDMAKTAYTYTGTVAAIENIFSGQFGVINGMVIDRDGKDDITGDEIPTIGGGMITIGDIVDGAVAESIGSITMNAAGHSGYAAYISDDYMAVVLDSAIYGAESFPLAIEGSSVVMENQGGILVTSNEEAGDDYASWGYWAASFGDPAATGFEISPVSTWVAGIKTDPSVISALSGVQDVHYSGKVIGFVADISENLKIINTAASNVDIYVDFGVVNPISGTMSFGTDTTTTTWNMDIGSSTSSITPSASSLTADLSGTANGISVSGDLHGNFFGVDLADNRPATIGASFGAAGYDLISGEAYAATGAIKANKQP